MLHFMDLVRKFFVQGVPPLFQAAQALHQLAVDFKDRVKSVVVGGIAAAAVAVNDHFIPRPGNVHSRFPGNIQLLLGVLPDDRHGGDIQLLQAGGHARHSPQSAGRCVRR